MNAYDLKKMILSTVLLYSSAEIQGYLLNPSCLTPIFTPNFALYFRPPTKYQQLLALESRVVLILGAPSAALLATNTIRASFSSIHVLLANASSHTFNHQEYCLSVSHFATLEISTGPTGQNLWMTAHTCTLFPLCPFLPFDKPHQLKQFTLSMNLVHIIITTT